MYTIRVTNGGPGTATNVELVNDLPNGVTLLATSGGSCVAGDPLVCALGNMAPGAEVVVTIVVRAPEGGVLANSATVRADQLDPVGDNSVLTRLTVVPPEPLLGARVVVEVVRGRVFIRRPGAAGFVELLGADDIPVGSLVDTRRGAVELTSATGLPSAARSPAGTATTQSAVFYDGLFLVNQPRVRGAYTTLALRGGNFRRICGSRALASVDAKKKPRPVRRLWGNGKGRFRTKGKHSSATVRGTIWLTSDRCDGTFTYVRQGRVAVRDRVLKRTVILRPGQTYLARPRQP